MELIAGITDFLKAIVAFIPRRESIPITHRGVKFRNGRFFSWFIWPFIFWTQWWKNWQPQAIQLGPGIHWWWPLFSQVETIPVNRQVRKLEAHDVMTKDGKPVRFRGTASYTISSVMRALVRTWAVENNIDDEVEAAFCSFVSSVHSGDLSGSREELNDRLTSVVSEQMKIYGVKILRAKLTTLCTGCPIMLVGMNFTPNAEK